MAQKKTSKKTPQKRKTPKPSAAPTPEVGLVDPSQQQDKFILVRETALQGLISELGQISLKCGSLVGMLQSNSIDPSKIPPPEPQG